MARPTFIRQMRARIIGGVSSAELYWNEVALHDFTAGGNVAAPATDGGSITVGTLSLGTDNGDGGAGRGTIVNTASTGLVLTPAASTAQSIALVATTRTAVIATVALDDVNVSASDEEQDIIILWKIAAFAPPDNSAFFQIGYEQTANPLSSASTGRGELFGPGRSGATQQFHEGYQDTSGVGGAIVAVSSPPSSSSARVLAMRLQGKSTASFYFSNTVGHFDSDTPLTVLTKYSSGTSRQRSAPPPGPMRLIAALSSPSVVSPTAATIQGLRVLKLSARTV